MPLTMEELDKLFCMMGKKYGIKKLILKAVASVESSMNERAWRFEPGFWKNYKTKILARFPELAGRDINEVSASHGLMQLMFTTAWGLGFRGNAEDLYNPVINIELGAKLMRQLLDSISIPAGSALWPIEVCLARYNGGSFENPDEKGKLRTQKYVDKVLLRWAELKKKEVECSEQDT